jgi:anaerobic selenocysteine-containing dehydrogenase
LLEGPGQIRALISCGGNPVAAWPDQQRTLEAFRQLELLVQIDPWMSATATRAHYVIAPKMGLEVPATTQWLDVLEGKVTMGGYEAHGQYTPAIVDAPAGSDLIEEWEFYYGLAQRLGLQLKLHPVLQHAGLAPVELDMVNKPTTDELLELTTAGSRISLAQIKAHSHGALYPDPPVFVQAKENGWSGRLNIGKSEMMEDLAVIAARTEPSQELYPFHLISRRMRHSYNSSYRNNVSTNRGRPYNPAFMNPGDLESLHLAPRDLVQIRSARASILAIVMGDESVRRGCVSMTHCFGDAPEHDSEVLEIGSPTNRLIDVMDVNERYSGQARMSGIPVAVSPSV